MPFELMRYYFTFLMSDSFKADFVFVVVVLNEYFIRIQRVSSLNLFSTTQIDLILGG